MQKYAIPAQPIKSSLATSTSNAGIHSAASDEHSNIQKVGVMIGSQETEDNGERGNQEHMRDDMLIHDAKVAESGDTSGNGEEVRSKSYHGSINVH